MHPQKQYKAVPTLLGDVGGTNIRLELALVQPPHNQPIQIYKKQTLAVENHATFIGALKQFLQGVKVYPEVVVIGIAGPIADNSVLMANVMKWGRLDGELLQKQLKVQEFHFINDFEAISYGLLVMPNQNFISLNGLNINDSKTRGVLGPGTGLGNSVMFCSPFRKRNRIYVLPSEGGHTDFTYSGNDDEIQYFKFFKEKSGIEYIGKQRSFCGPSLPYMFQFYASKHQDWPNSDLKPKPQQIIDQCLKQQEQKKQKSLYMLTLNLFIRIYSDTIGNFLCHHMNTGGLYLVGSLTNAILPFIKGKNLIANFCKRHYEIADTLEKIPIVVSKQIDLGLKGAFVFARRIISDNQHH